MARYSEKTDSERAHAQFGSPGTIFSLVSTKLVIDPETEAIHYIECEEGPNNYGIPVGRAFLHDGRETVAHYRIRWALEHDDLNQHFHHIMNSLYGYLSSEHAGEYFILPAGRYENSIGKFVELEKELNLTFDECALEYILEKA